MLGSLPQGWESMAVFPFEMAPQVDSIAQGLGGRSHRQMSPATLLTPLAPWPVASLSWVDTKLRSCSQGPTARCPRTAFLPPQLQDREQVYSGAGARSSGGGKVVLDKIISQSDVHAPAVSSV